MDTKRWGSANDIVLQSSAGAMLRGVIHGLDMDDVKAYKVARHNLVEIPTYLILRGPTFTLKTEHTKLNSKTESTAFEQSIDNTEISLGAEVKFKGILEWAGLGIEAQKTRINEQEKSTHKETKFYSEVNSKIFSAASLHFEKRHLQLSTGARKELEHIYDRVHGDLKKKHRVDRRRTLYHLCSSFFDRFGSHNMKLRHCL